MVEESHRDAPVAVRHGAPRVFISYSHDSEEHAERVLSLATSLRHAGVEAELDQYVEGTPKRGWPAWMLDMLDWAEFVLVVSTAVYYRRFRGKEEAGMGSGASWEGMLITQQLYEAHGKTTRFVPVVFDKSDANHIPEPIRGSTRYLVSDSVALEKLVAFLQGRAGVEREPLQHPPVPLRPKGKPLFDKPTPVQEAPLPIDWEGRVRALRARVLVTSSRAEVEDLRDEHQMMMAEMESAVPSPSQAARLDGLRLGRNIAGAIDGAKRMEVGRFLQLRGALQKSLVVVAAASALVVANLVQQQVNEDGNAGGYASSTDTSAATGVGIETGSGAGAGSGTGTGTGILPVGTGTGTGTGTATMVPKRPCWRGGEASVAAYAAQGATLSCVCAYVNARPSCTLRTQTGLGNPQPVGRCEECN